MKKLVLSLVSAVLIQQSAEASVPVSVLSFKNKVGNVSCDTDWLWWNDNLGSAFKDMLLSELGKNENLMLLERENIEKINDRELNLVNSENSSHKIAKGKFTKAKYTIVGSVSSYEYCAEKKRVRVPVSAVAGFFGLGGAAGEVADQIDDVGFSSAHAKVVIDLRVVETETGRIVKTVSAEGKAARNNFKVRSNLASYDEAMETPVGEAARNAIERAAGKIIGAVSKAN